MGVSLVLTWSSSSIWNWVKMWWRKARTTGKAGPWSSAISGDSRSRFSAPRIVAVSWTGDGDQLTVTVWTQAHLTIPV